MATRSSREDPAGSLMLRIVLEGPPAGVDFGLQKGRGADYETIQKQRSRGDDLRFEFEVATHGVDEEGEPVLRGPFVQGPAGQRFVYLDIGTYAGQKDTPWSRRLKVPLSGITEAMIARARSGNAGVLETRVPGTGKDGGPSCATVKPFRGWQIARG